MGTVMLGWDTKLDCPVAIKGVRIEGIDPTARQELEARLLTEARAAAKLNHPGIVKIKQMLEVAGSGYVVMEMVKGRTLDTVAPLSRPTDSAFTLRVLRECAAALDHAHARNIVHRDIKPGNIMIDDDTGAVLITDFGIAKILDSGHHTTEPGMIIGTLEYMAPEQLLTSTVDGRADQFALAVIAFRMLTGQPLYTADTIRRLSFQIAHEDPRPAHDLNSALPPSVDTVLRKALTKRPDDRYPTCQDFTKALEEALTESEHPMIDDPVVDLFQNRSTTDDPASNPAIQPDRSGVIEPSSNQNRNAPVPPAVSARKIKKRRSRPVILLSVSLAILGGVVVLLNWRAPLPPPLEIKSQLTKPRSLRFPSGDMVLVDAGEAKLGEMLHPANLADFYIDKTEVTNSAYLRFCRETGHPMPRGANTAPPEDPVVNVTFSDAEAFAQWAGKRLPSAEEWEKAARGPSGRVYPWGNEWRDDAANIPTDAASKKRSSLAPAYSFLKGESPYGALNMLGNAWEWVATEAQPDPRAFELLRNSFKNLRPPLTRDEAMYQVRGGSFKFSLRQELPEDDPNRVKAPSLVWDSLVLPARGSLEDVGFRCAKNP